MRTRLTWIVAILALVSIGVLMACSTKYNSSYDGLVVVPSQGGGPAIENQGGPVMESFSLDVSNGHVYDINNVNGPPTSGIPTSVILDPAGAFAYVIIYANPEVTGGGVTGIETFQIASDGKLGTGSAYTLNNANVIVQVNGQNSSESVPVVPVALTIDSAGKFLFVANSATSDTNVPSNPVPGSISVLAIGSNATLTEVPGSPFVLPVGGVNLPLQNPCTSSVACPSPLALAISRTAYPPLYAYCSQFTPPTTENLYVPDSTSYVLLNYSVSSTGSLSLVPTSTATGVPTETTPDGVAVDPCNRFVYVANAGPGNSGTSVSAYTICSTVLSPNCPNADYRLLPVKGSPYPVGDLPGPMAVDAYGSFLYVVDTGSSEISAFRISPTNGSLTPMTPATVATGLGANSIAIRGDDSWVFVANITAGTLSQYSITLSTGQLTAQPPTSTFNYPSSVAVK
jgi:6-phosphogluconolactonase (cycloisomerase 2 family)